MNKRLMAGFTLIEVLITSVIVAIGLLGLTAMQLTQLRNTNQAIDGSIAAIYLNDIAERIRANSSQAPLYLATHATLPSEIDCKAAICNAAEMAQYDLYNWQNEVMTYLPSGGGEIKQTATDITISIRWDQNLSGSTEKNCPSLTDADLDCLTVIITI